MIANDWGAGSALLHLRERLKDQAKDCGQGQSVRFGMTTKEARTKLAGLRRTCRTTLQEHAMEVERLTNIAYPDLPDYTRQEMAVDTFCGSLENAYLQRHLLAIPTPTLEAAVRAGNEFLQVRPNMIGSGIRAVQPGEPEEEFEQAAVANMDQDPMTTMLKIMQDLVAEVKNLETRIAAGNHNPGSWETRESAALCWNCNQPGHWKRDCPRKQRSRSNQTQENQGNANRPQQ